MLNMLVSRNITYSHINRNILSCCSNGLLVGAYDEPCFVGLHVGSVLMDDVFTKFVEF